MRKKESDILSNKLIVTVIAVSGFLAIPLQFFIILERSPLLVVLSSVLYLSFIIASIGLLKHKKWGRWHFIVNCTVGIEVELGSNLRISFYR